MQPGLRFFQPSTAVTRLLAFLLKPWVSRLRFHDDCVSKLKALGEKGHVVYVMRLRSLLDYILLKIITQRYELPQPHFVNSFPFWLWLPLRSWWRRFAGKKSGARKKESYANDVNWLSAAAMAAPASLLFLRRRPPMWRRDMLPDRPYISSLMELQRHADRPIYLVPTLLLWEKRPRRMSRSLLDVVFGPAETPGRIRKWWLFVRHRHTAFFRVGDPIDLSVEAPNMAGEDEPTLNRKIRRVLLLYLSREERVIQGPALPDRKRVISQILRDRKMAKFIEEQAQAEGTDVQAIEKRAQKSLEEIASNYDIRVIQLLDWILQRVWKRIYSGLEVDEDGLEMIRRVSRDASIVFTPCHKSHVDYLVLPWVTYRHDISTPYIAAGINLNVFLFGSILRRGGAYFIRRSFHGDKAYAMAFERYVVYLLKHGFFQLFYIEGTRSRTGKLMPPKYGMLGMMLRAYLSGEVKKMVFIPCSVGYEKIVESGAYTQELTGGEKQQESFSGFLKSRKVLRQRYGKVYVRFSQPIDPEGIFSPQQLQELREKGADGPEADSALKRLGGAILDGINEASVVHPGALTAMVLLTHPKRGIARSKLLGRANTLLDLLMEYETPLANAFVDVEAALDSALEIFLRNQTIEAIEFEGETIYSIVEKGRIDLDIAKNNAIHVFAPISLASSALLAALIGEVTYSGMGLESFRVRLGKAADLYAFIRRMMGDEFRFPGSDGSDAQSLLDAVKYFIDRDLLRYDSETGTITVTQRSDFFGRSSLKTLVLYSLLTYNFLEAYYLVLDSMGHLIKKPMDSKSFVDFCLKRGERIFRVGSIVKREAILQPLVASSLAHFKKTGMVGQSEPEGKRAGKKGGLLFMTPEQDIIRQETMGRMKYFFEYHKQRFLGI